MFHLIDFEIVGRIMRDKKKLGRRVKSMNHQWNTMQVCCKWGKSTIQICPICGISDENWEHAYRCPNEDMDRVRMDAMNNLYKKLEKLKTLPELRNHFVAILKHWHQGNMMVQVEKINSPYYAMLQDTKSSSPLLDLIHLSKAYYKKNGRKCRTPTTGKK